MTQIINSCSAASLISDRQSVTLAVEKLYNVLRIALFAFT
jgi:hypothetical protein